MQEWLRSKLDRITFEFLEGSGNGIAYEAQFLAYLECLVAHQRGPAAAISVWHKFMGACAEASNPPACFSSRIYDRQELVNALREFQHQFEGPKQHAFTPPKSRAQKPPVVRSTDEAVDILDLLGG